MILDIIKVLAKLSIAAAIAIDYSFVLGVFALYILMLLQEIGDNINDYNK